MKDKVGCQTPIELQPIVRIITTNKVIFTNSKNYHIVLHNEIIHIIYARGYFPMHFFSASAN